MIGQVVLEKKMLTDHGRGTTHDDGRQPIAIGHLSDSGDLKKHQTKRFKVHMKRSSMQIKIQTGIN